MQLARLRKTLWLTAAACAGGAALAVALARTLPLNGTDLAAVAPTLQVPATAPANRDATIPPLGSFEAAWSLPLRRPLVDPPPPALIAAAPLKPPGPSVRLIGTIVDGDRPRGIFITGLTTIELKTVGEKAGGASIVQIDENSATLSFDGNMIVLKREKKPFDASGESYDAALRSAAPGTTPEPAGGS